ncbi:glycosyltransferase family 4 protein [Pedobacter sp. CFBP9032]|uniref:glycosyltransferase family 4 protein n=1 Tax=Pedobacter sp. CFBP9032 TaxID=3096539 RepID=UPI002A6B40CA|nr:glycosyltransferase family 4 protein [Pedobacter sp. CFBP9032]MDY0907458.1 glycosyltransferase family 4 protein [Pedobacter sp. CFBP9032]
MKSLAIIVTHPIQYYVPVYQQLAKPCQLKVFYTWGEKGANAKYDPDFQKNISWDIPLLDGYEFEFVENSAKDPGSHHYKGIVNPELIEKIKAFNPDAILVYGWAYKSHLAVMRHFKGKIPVWFRGDSTLMDQTGSLQKIFRKLFLIWVYQHIDIAFYVGKANKAYFKAFGVKEKQLVFAPHAVDNERFSTDRSIEALHLRQKLGISANDTLILFAGKFEEKKDPTLLLQAFTAPDRKTDNHKLTTKNEQRTTTTTHLLFVGNGELEETLKMHTSVQHNNIHFLDFQNQTQMPVIYQACDLFCLPSQGPGETWGLAVNEAMASSKAILVSDKVGCAESLIQEGKNGEIFKSGNLEDLSIKLRVLLANPQKLLQMGMESKKIIENWSFKQQVETIAKELNEGH